MGALTVLLIRHAEKPGGDWPGPGLNADGAVDSKSLVVRGWQRAGAWAALFGSSADDDYRRPTALYAAKPDDDPGAEPSRRPYETIIPLATRLALQPVSEYAKGQEAALADSIRVLEGVILVCWEHKAIVKSLLPALVSGAQVAPDLPRNWDDARFDVVLRLDRLGFDAPWSYRQLFPKLLSGDTAAPL